MLDDVVDIHMPGAKYGDNRVAVRYSNAPNYTRVVGRALAEMHRRVGELVVVKGIALRGLLIRHLVLPHSAARSERVFEMVGSVVGEGAYINVMGQYHPSFKADEYP